MGIKVVVPISGGKDSQACGKLAVKEHGAENVLGVFCDTRFEHPLTYEHVKRVGELYGIEIITLNNGDVSEKVRKHEQFPTGKSRFCTEELKLWPAKKFYRDFAKQQGGFEVWLGMRTAESRDRKKRYIGKVGEDVYAPHEVLGKFPKNLEKMGVMFRLPVLEWSTRDVFEYLGDEINPLYGFGFDRVGCFPCLAAGKGYQRKAFGFDETGAKHREIVRQLERDIGKRHAPADVAQMCMFCQI